MNIRKSTLDLKQTKLYRGTHYLPFTLTPGRSIETLESFNTGTQEAKHLGVRVGFPLILLQDHLYTSDDIAYEYSRIYFRGDKIKIKIETSFPSNR